MSLGGRTLGQVFHTFKVGDSVSFVLIRDIRLLHVKLKSGEYFALLGIEKHNYNINSTPEYSLIFHKVYVLIELYIPTEYIFFAMYPVHYLVPIQYVHAFETRSLGVPHRWVTFAGSASPMGHVRWECLTGGSRSLGMPHRLVTFAI